MLRTICVFQIDSVQSLLQCPGILVCVGREPFHPLLLDSFRKHSYDKLPRLNTKSRSSVCSDEKAAKKNGRSHRKKSFSLSLIINSCLTLLFETTWARFNISLCQDSVKTHSENFVLKGLEVGPHSPIFS